MSDDLITARSYLLGELAEPEQLAFEVRLIEDAELHETVAAIEDELLDEYVAGELPGPARARLDARLALEPTLRDRVAVSGALQRMAASRPGARRRTRRWWPTAPIAAAVMAAIVLLLVMRPGGAPGPDDDVSVTLPPPTRESEVVEVTLTARARHVRLALALAPAPGLRAEVRGPAGVVPVTVVAAGPRVVLELDAAQLAPGLYDVVVTVGAEVVQRSQLRVRL